MSLWTRDKKWYMRCKPWEDDGWGLCNGIEWVHDDVSIWIIFGEFLDSTSEEIFGSEGLAWLLPI